MRKPITKIKKVLVTIILKITKNNSFSYLLIGNHLKFWSSGGSCGYSHFRKKTSAASFSVGYEIHKLISKFKKELPIKYFIILKGKTRFRRDIIQGLTYKRKMKVSRIVDQSKVPFNGCKFRKARRL
jgi:ribosomal protein S11